MKIKRDCSCPCHGGGVAIHVVPCCDGMVAKFFRKLKRKKTAAAEPK